MPHERKYTWSITWVSAGGGERFLLQGQPWRGCVAPGSSDNLIMITFDTQDTEGNCWDLEETWRLKAGRVSLDCRRSDSTPDNRHFLN